MIDPPDDGRREGQRLTLQQHVDVVNVQRDGPSVHFISGVEVRRHVFSSVTSR